MEKNIDYFKLYLDAKIEIAKLKTNIKTLETQISVMENPKPKLHFVIPDKDFKKTEDDDDDETDVCKKKKYLGKNRTWIQVIESDEKYMRYLYEKNYIPPKVHTFMMENYDMSGWMR